MAGKPRPSRRDFLFAGTATGTGLWVAGLASAAEAGEEEEISPAEDLMREHGVLNRILLIYEEAVSRVAQIEKALGIYNLAQFTPAV